MQHETARGARGARNRSIRTGLVGCGHMGTRHLDCLRRVPGVVVTGLCDSDPRLAAAAAAAHPGGAPYPGIEAMLAADPPDVVHIVTPPASHHALARKALEAGCHVLVEKPMALNAREADDMVEAAGRGGARLCVAHNFLFEPAVRRARAMCERGALGTLTAVEIYWRVLRGAVDERTPAWIHELPGGVFQEVAPHAFYLMHSLLDAPRVAAVSAKATGTANGGPDELRVLFESATAVGSVAISQRSEPHLVTLRIHGTRASVLVDLTTNVLVRLRKLGLGRVAKVGAALDRSAQYLFGTGVAAARTLVGRSPTGRQTLIRSFYDSLRAEVAPPVTAEDGRAVVASLDEVWRRLDLSRAAERAT